jgi:hypothetical protein
MAKVFTKGAVYLLAGTLLSTVAAASPIQKFDFGGSGGTISYTQAPGQSLMADALIQTLVKLPGTAKFTVTGGYMNVTTGGCSLTGTGCYKANGTNSLVLKFFNSSPTGITIYGAISQFGITSVVELLAGELVNTGATLNGSNPNFKNSASCTAAQQASGKCGPNTGNVHSEIAATFINQNLLKGLGFLPDNTSNPKNSINQLDFLLYADATLGKFGTTIGGLGTNTLSQIKLTDITITPSPEPASLLLFGSSLLLAAGYMRRKFIAR